MAYYNENELQPVHAADAWDLDRYLFTAVAYLARAGKKDGSSYDEDVLKALWFLAYAVTRNSNYADTVKTVCYNLTPGANNEEREATGTSNKLSEYVGSEAGTRDPCGNRQVRRVKEPELVSEASDTGVPNKSYPDRVRSWLKGAIE
jgi:hypothetical protein